VKKRILVLSLAAASLSFGTGTVVADGDQPWHVTGTFGTINLDSDRNTRNNDVLWGIGFGRFFGNNFSLDLEYDQFSGTFRDAQVMVPGTTFDQWKLSNWGGMARYHIGQAKVRPFVAVGLGTIKHRNVMNVNNAISASMGIGLAGQFAKHLSGRLQVIYRSDGDNRSLATSNSYGDWIWTVSIGYNFGGKPPPPPPPRPAPAAAPPPPPNPDLDGDGVPNTRDKCPNTRPGAVVDLDGCEVEAVIALDGVHFDFDKATLTPAAKAVLNGAAALLDQNERVVVQVAGHTDSIGTESYNQGLSDRRANSVKDYLVNKGVKASRMTARGYGESQPVASNDTEAGRAENRRVELIVLDR
jgi:OOP family OmpA-OmpF porin